MLDHQRDKPADVGSPPTQSLTLRAAMLASGNVLTALVGMVSLAVLVRVLPVQAYATYRQVLLTYAVVAPLLTFGLPEALYYFLPASGERARSILVGNLIVLTAAGVLLGAFLALGGGGLIGRFFGNEQAGRGLMIMAAYPAFTLPAAAVGPCLVALGRTTQAALFNVLSRFFLLSTVIVSCLIWRSAEAALLANVVGAAIVLPIGLLLVLAACPGRTRLTIEGMTEQVHYAAPIWLTSVIATTATSVDKVVVASSCSPEDFAVYVNGAMEIPLVGVLTGSAMAVLLPEMAKAWKQSRPLEALGLWQRAATKTALGLFPAFWLLLLVAPDFIAVLYSPKYLASVPVFRIYLLLLPLRVVYFGAALMAARRGRQLLITSSIGLLSNIALSVPLVRLAGHPGAAWAVVASLYLFQIAITIHLVKRAYGVSYFRVLPFPALGRIGMLALLPVVVVLPVIWMGSLSSAVRLFVAGAVYAVGVVLTFALAKLIDVQRMLTLARAAVLGRSDGR